MASEAITGWKFPGCTRTQRKPRFSLLRTRRFREILRIPRSRESLDSSPIYPEDLRFHAELASQVHANFAPYTFSGSGSQKSAVDNLWETTPSRRCSTGVIIIPHFLLTSSVQRCTIGIERQEMKTMTNKDCGKCKGIGCWLVRRKNSQTGTMVKKCAACHGCGKELTKEQAV